MTETAQKRTGQTKARRDCFLHHSWLSADGRWTLTCHDCKCEIDCECSPWTAEHLVVYFLTRDNSPMNVWPSCNDCATRKTKIDAGQIAKTKRIIRKNTEPHEPSRMRSRPMQSGAKLAGGGKLPTGRKLQSGAKLRSGSKLASARTMDRPRGMDRPPARPEWKRKMDGSTVRREKP